MIRHLLFGMRLGLLGDRRSAARTVTMLAGVAVSVLVLMAVVSIPGMMAARDARLLARQPQPATGEASFLYARTNDLWSGQTIARVNLARLRDDVRPPGLPALPGEGEAYVSPALEDLIASDSTGLLGARYGTDPGTIGDEGLASPDELIGYVGVDPAALRADDGAFVAGGGFGATEAGIAAIADERINPTSTTFAIALLLVSMFVVFLSVCVRLSSLSQERRLSAMRLAGASANQARVVLAGELMLATVGGALLGFAAFLLSSRVSEGWHLGSATWFTEDIRPGFLSAVVLVGIPLLGHVVAQAGARRSIRDAFHVRRDARQSVAGLWRLIPITAGLTTLVVVVSAPLRPNGWGADEIQIANLVAIVLCVVGFPLALPVVIRLVAAALGRSGYVPLHLAARRLGHEPSSATRVAVGAGIAVLIVGVAGSYVADIAAADTEYLDRADLAAHDDFIRVDADLLTGDVDDLRRVEGVESVTGLELLRIVRKPASPLEEHAWVVGCVDAIRYLGGDADEPCPDGVVRVAFAGRSDAPETFCSSDASCVEVAPLQAGETVRLRAANGGAGAAPATATVPTATRILPAPPHFVPEIASVALLVPSSKGGSPSFETALVSTDGAERTEQQIRNRVLALDEAAEVTTQRGVFQLRTQRRDFERALLETGVLFALLISLAAGLVAGLDAIWERRRQMVVLLSAGIAPKILRRAQAFFLSIPLLISCFLGAGVGALVDAALDTGAGVPVSVAGDVAVSLLLVVAASFAFASLVARWAISMKGLRDAVRTP